MTCKAYVYVTRRKSQLDRVIRLWDKSVVSYMIYLSSGMDCGAHAADIDQPRNSKYKDKLRAKDRKLQPVEATVIIR